MKGRKWENEPMDFISLVFLMESKTVISVLFHDVELDGNLKMSKFDPGNDE
jgi:hypothetical protein